MLKSFVMITLPLRKKCLDNIFFQFINKSENFEIKQDFITFQLRPLYSDYKCKDIPIKFLKGQGRQ